MRLELDQSTTSIPVTGDPSLLNANEAREALEQGIKAAQSGDRSRARVALLRASDLDPHNENAWLWLASISEYPEELLVFLSNVLDINPNNARALEWTAATRSLLAKTFVQRGIDAVEENQADFAIECFNKGLEYDQQNAMAWMWLASLSDSDQGKITYLEKVIEIEPENVEALAGIEAAKISINAKLLAQARVAAVSGQKDEAIEITKAIIAESDNCADAWLLRSHLVDNFEDKIACLDKVLEIDPENTAAAVSRESLAAIVGMAAPQPAAEPSEVTEPEIPTSEPISLEMAEVNSSSGDKSPTQELEMPEGMQFEGDAVQPESEPDLSLTMMGTIYAMPESNCFESPAECVPVEESSVFVPSAEDIGANTDVSISEMFVEPLEVFDHPSGSDGFPAIPLPTYMTSESTIDFSSVEPLPDEAFGIPMPLSSLPEVPVIPSGYETTVERRSEPRIVAAASHSCPFCNASNDAQSISCGSCLAVLTLSDLEMLLANQHADKFILREAVGRMQQEQSARQLSESELTMLGIGHLNLRNLQFGYDCLQEAAKLNPNNVVLGSQVNALLIRLEEIRKQEEAQEKMPKGKTILVVDDSPTVRKLIAGKLEKCGHQVVCSNDGVEALEKLEAMIPDLVLLDITMPRMDGYQACKAIRSNPATKDVPIVMISGKDGFFDKVRGRMAGTTGYITKPFGPETLMKAVEVYLRGEIPDTDL